MPNSELSSHGSIENIEALKIGFQNELTYLNSHFITSSKTATNKKH